MNSTRRPGSSGMSKTEIIRDGERKISITAQIEVSDQKIDFESTRDGSRWPVHIQLFDESAAKQLGKKLHAIVSADGNAALEEAILYAKKAIADKVDWTMSS